MSYAPNFIGIGRVIAEVVLVEELGSRISPGRWRSFRRQILVTTGFSDRILLGWSSLWRNCSHMAIRAAEKGIPAAIGVASRFERVSRAARLSSIA